MFSLVRVAFYLTLIGVNRPFARWRHFTTTTRIIFVFPFIFRLDNLSNLHKNGKILKDSGRGSRMTSSCKWPICLVTVWRLLRPSRSTTFWWRIYKLARITWSETHRPRKYRGWGAKRKLSDFKIAQGTKLHRQNGLYPIWSTVYAHRFKIKQNQVKLISTVSGVRVSCGNFHPSCDYDVKSLLLTAPNQLIRKGKDQSTLVCVI